MDKNIKSILETVNFIKDHMLTKDEGATKDDVRTIVREQLEPIDNRLQAVESKVDGINRRLDADAMYRTDLSLPRRVHDLEESIYGAGNSRHPKHIPL